MKVKTLVAHSDRMVRVRFNAVGLAVALAILGGYSFAQNQDSLDVQPQRKWLVCDVDWIFTPYDVGTDFSVRLAFHQTPLPGIRVVITPSGELRDAGGRPRVPVTAMTDSSGTAHFLAVTPGKYNAGAKNGLDFPSNEVTVHSAGEGDFDAEIEIEWPLEPLPVRTLRGWLLVPGEGDKPDRPFRSVTVNLVDLRSTRVVETQRTLEDGSYEFSTVEPGLFVVRVIPPTKDKKTKELSGDLAVELDPVAQEATIPGLKVLQSECAGVQLLRQTKPGQWE
jgi:hypothetical protein